MIPMKWDALARSDASDAFIISGSTDDGGAVDVSWTRYYTRPDLILHAVYTRWRRYTELETWPSIIVLAGRPPVKRRCRTEALGGRRPAMLTWFFSLALRKSVRICCQMTLPYCSAVAARCRFWCRIPMMLTQLLIALAYISVDRLMMRVRRQGVMLERVAAAAVAAVYTSQSQYVYVHLLPAIVLTRFHCLYIPSAISTTPSRRHWRGWAQCTVYDAARESSSRVTRTRVRKQYGTVYSHSLRLLARLCCCRLLQLSPMYRYERDKTRKRWEVEFVKAYCDPRCPR